MGNGFGLDCRQDHVIAVCNDDGPRSSSVGCINQHMTVPSLLNDPFDRRRFGADNGDNAVSGYNVAESDVDKFNGHLGPPRPYRFPLNTTRENNAGSSSDYGNKRKKQALYQYRRIFSRLFDILHLLADFFKLCFHVDDCSSKLGVIGFGANRIYFPVHLLNQKIKLAS